PCVFHQEDLSCLESVSVCTTQKGNTQLLDSPCTDHMQPLSPTLTYVVCILNRLSTKRSRAMNRFHVTEQG
ncbi:hypothetical protein BaRGS_00008185, partial [Batillaria attramentaria]